MVVETAVDSVAVVVDEVDSEEAGVASVPRLDRQSTSRRWAASYTQ